MSTFQIPDQAGAILLPDCTLFPHGALPLHIFEIRYREMLAEALEGDCLFAVGHLHRDECHPYEDCTSRIGTIGMIRVSREKGDGCSDLLLHGLCRVRFLEWLPDKPYPWARLEALPCRWHPDQPTTLLSRRLRDTIEKLLVSVPESAAQQVRAMLERASDPAVLSDAVAQQFVQPPELRQKLLEELDVTKRLELLNEHLGSLRAGEG